MAEGAAEEIAKVHGTNYTVGPGGRTRECYQASSVTGTESQTQESLQWAAKEYRKSTDCAYIVYVASGTSIDYVHEVLGVNYSYGAELRDTGKHGFLLPKEEILPTCEESFAGVEFMLEKLRL